MIGIMKVIAGNSNNALAQSLAKSLSTECAQIELSTFDNGEKRVHITESLQGEDIVLVQSFSNPADAHIIESLLIIDALERMGAGQIIVVVPWMGYSLQDKVFRPGEPMAAKVVADLLSHAYVHRVLLLDLHNPSIPGFFSVPCQHLSADQLFKKYVHERHSQSETVIASPDFGGIKRARSFAQLLDMELVNIDKARDLKSGKVSVEGLHGDVEGKDVLLLDDVILSGSTAAQTAQEIKKQGARSVHFLATHGLFVSGAQVKLENSVLDSIVITNSIHHEELPGRCRVLDCAPLFAQALTPWV